MNLEWKRLEEYLQNYLPESLHDLRAGATQEQLQEAEHVLGIRLPEPYRQSLLRHDGQEGRAPGIIGNWRLLPIAESLREWKLWRELLQMNSFAGWDVAAGNGVRSEAWNLAWLPITVDDKGNHHCLDMDPAPHGHPGQVIVVYANHNRRELVADNFDLWLQHILRHLEAGNYQVVNDELGIRFDNNGFLQPITSVHR